MKKASYDDFADYYHRFRTDMSAQLGFKLKDKCLLEKIGDVTDLRICDLACGEGYLSRLLSEKGARITGVDISRKLLELAIQASPSGDIQYVYDDAENLSSLKNGTFDVVVCNMALMDIPHLSSTYKAVHRILKVSGRFVFLILHPCFESPRYKQKEIETDQEENFVAKRVYRYSPEGFWNSGGDGVRGRVGAYHRTIATYVNQLVQVGFVLSSLEEPMLPPGNYQDPKDQWEMNVPRYLIVEGVRSA